MREAVIQSSDGYQLHAMEVWQTFEELPDEASSVMMDVHKLWNCMEAFAFF
jgi:uncharacterized protein YfbU (UPF0304 family)